MSFPTDKPPSGITTPPGVNQAGETQPTSQPPAQPAKHPAGIAPVHGSKAIPPSPDGFSSKEAVTQRGITPHSPSSEINTTARVAALKQSYAKQWNTVQAMRAQNHLINNLDAIIQSLNSPDTFTGSAPFTIIHIGENGKMIRLHPPEKGFREEAVNVEPAKNQLVESLRAFDKSLGRTETRMFREELGAAEATLVGFGQQLKSAGVSVPSVPMGFSPVSIVEFLQTRVPEKAPRPTSPSTSTATKDVQYQGLPAHKAKPDEPEFSEDVPSTVPKPPFPVPPATPSTKPAAVKDDESTEEDEDDTLPRPSADDFINPDIPPEHLTAPPSYLAELNKYRVFKDPSRHPGHVVEDAVGAMTAGDELTPESGSSYGKAHITRKALLFGLLINLHKISGRNEAIYLNKETVRLIQLGMMYTNISEDDLLQRKANPAAEQKCKAFLLEGEQATPPVAAFVASIVAGTAHQDSLPARVMRDVIRLEAMRYADQFDLDSLESNAIYEIPDTQKTITTKFCEQWRALLAKEGELSKPAALINRSDSVTPVPYAYSAEDHTALRESFETNKNPYAKHLELLANDEQLSLLKNLL